jgi:hypothetical protein
MNFTSIHGRRFGINERNNLMVAGSELFTPKAVDVTVTTAELLALNTTPKALVAAPGAGRVLIPAAAYMFLDYNSTAYAGIVAGADLAVRYTNGSGAIALTVETTGFLDQTSDQYRFTFGAASPAATGGGFAPVANAALVLHMTTGNIATGNSPLYVRVYYYDLSSAFPAPAT